ncbi:alpha/beta fold hydrolase [Haloarchaeobius sp. DFWS5]|uniref:alpha/beta fold hydrolase n=1 Tax=Haloarchaeobius sp. DFWS5 TaxID=3446114 RepID=UPI003EC0EDF7
MDLPTDWTTDSLQTNGVELQYYRTGDGPPVVMAHGFGENGRCFEPLASALADEYEVITYDARAHGHSGAPESGYDIEDRVADLVGLVESLDLDDPILLGHSMGGSTVAWTAATHPELPRAVVLEDPAAMYGESEMSPGERAEIVREQLAEDAEKTVEERADEYQEFTPEQARRHAVADDECRTAIAEIAREGYPQAPDAFPDIECPALVLLGDREVERRVAAYDAAEALEQGRLVHVPGAGHYVFETRFDAAFAELQTFLRRLPER